MGRADRGVRRACRHLATGEVVIASVLALESDGRRRRVVLVTDRRVLITGARNEPDEEFDLDASTGEYHRVGGILTLRSGDRETAVRDVDELAGRTVRELLGARIARREAHTAVRPVHASRIAEPRSSSSCPMPIPASRARNAVNSSTGIATSKLASETP